jgi:hypothetical protein
MDSLRLLRASIASLSTYMSEFAEKALAEFACRMPEDTCRRISARRRARRPV